MKTIQPLLFFCTLFFAATASAGSNAQDTIAIESYQPTGNDYSPAFDKALAKLQSSNGGCITVRSTINLSRTLSLPDNITLLGQGSTAGLVFDGQNMGLGITGSNIAIQHLTLQGISKVYIGFKENASGIRIAGNTFNTNARSTSIYADSPNLRDLVIEDNQFNNANYAILVNQRAKNITGVVIRNNTFRKINADAIELNLVDNTEKPEGRYDFTITGNDLQGVPDISTTAGFGIGIARTRNVWIDKNRIAYFSTQCIHIEDGSANIAITNNILQQYYTNDASKINAGVYVIDGNNLLVTGNTISQCDDAGILLDYDPRHHANHYRIYGNQIENNRKNGISVYGHSDANGKIFQNTIGNNGGFGIYDGSDSKSIQISGNTLRKNLKKDMMTKKELLAQPKQLQQ